MFDVVELFERMWKGSHAILRLLSMGSVPLCVRLRSTFSEQLSQPVRNVAMPNWSLWWDDLIYLQVTVAYNKDQSPVKVNLGVGAYRTEVIFHCIYTVVEVVSLLTSSTTYTRTSILTLRCHWDAQYMQEGKPLVLDVVRRAEQKLLTDMWVLWPYLVPFDALLGFATISRV